MISHLFTFLKSHLNISTGKSKTSSLKYVFTCNKTPFKKITELIFRLAKGVPSDVNRWLGKIPHMLNTDLEEAFLRMK